MKMTHLSPSKTEVKNKWI